MFLKVRLLWRKPQENCLPTSYSSEKLSLQDKALDAGPCSRSGWAQGHLSWAVTWYRYRSTSSCRAGSLRFRATWWHVPTRPSTASQPKSFLEPSSAVDEPKSLQGCRTWSLVLHLGCNSPSPALWFPGFSALCLPCPSHGQPSKPFSLPSRTPLPSQHLCTTMQPNAITREDKRAPVAKLQRVDPGQLGTSPAPWGAVLNYLFSIYRQSNHFPVSNSC